MNFELLKKAIAESAAELGITEYEIYYESESSVSAAARVNAVRI